MWVDVVAWVVVILVAGLLGWYRYVTFWRPFIQNVQDLGKLHTRLPAANKEKESR